MGKTRDRCGTLMRDFHEVIRSSIRNTPKVSRSFFGDYRFTGTQVSLCIHHQGGGKLT